MGFLAAFLKVDKLTNTKEPKMLSIKTLHREGEKCEITPNKSIGLRRGF